MFEELGSHPTRDKSGVAQITINHLQHTGDAGGQLLGTVLTRPVGLVSLGGHAGQAAAHVVHGNHPKLVVDVRGEAQDSRVDAAGVPGVVVPGAGLEAILLELHDVVWGEDGGLSLVVRHPGRLVRTPPSIHPSPKRQESLAADL